MTIKKAALLELKIPAALFRASDSIWADVPVPIDPFNDTPSIEARCICIKRTARRIHCARQQEDIQAVYALEKQIQSTIAVLYGHSKAEFESISIWYVQRERRNPPRQTYQAATGAQPFSSTV